MSIRKISKLLWTGNVLLFCLLAYAIGSHVNAQETPKTVVPKYEKPPEPKRIQEDMPDSIAYLKLCNLFPQDVIVKQVKHIIPLHERIIVERTFTDRPRKSCKIYYVVKGKITDKNARKEHEFLRENETIPGIAAKVISIEQDSVTFEYNGKEICVPVEK